MNTFKEGFEAVGFACDSRNFCTGEVTIDKAKAFVKTILRLKRQVQSKITFKIKILNLQDINIYQTSN